MTTKDQVAQLIVTEAKTRGHSRDECLAEMSCLYQESGWDETVWDATHTTYGIAQQDASYPNRSKGAAAQIAAFFDRLDKKRASPGHGDIWLNLFWLQQAPSRPTAQLAYQLGRQAYLTEIKSRIATVTPYLDKHWPTGGTTMVSGDPVWLEDVLRPALGDRLKTLPGWQDSGVGGTMGNIWGIIWHHTGNGAATAQSIRDGRPDLAGPLAQLHIAQDGTVTIVAVGPCNHAGKGSWNGLPTDNANAYTIGIECAWPRDTSITEATQTRERWPDAQIISMRDVGAALSLHLGVDSSHNISHKEWATLGPGGWRQGKWDPGNLDMNWFRSEIAKDMRGEFDKPTPSTPIPPATDPPVKAFPQGYTDRELLEYVAAQLGPWAQLGKNEKGENLTLVDAVAKLLSHSTVE